MSSISKTIRRAHEPQDAIKGVPIHAPRVLAAEEILVVAGGPQIVNTSLTH